MGWINVNDKMRTNFSCNFFFVENSSEIRYLKECILNEFPVFSNTQIEDAIRRSWETVSFPRPRQKFILTLKEKLGGQL